jgi:hypothetical protein
MKEIYYRKNIRILPRNKFTGTRSIQKRDFCTKVPFLLQNLLNNLKNIYCKPEYQSKTQQNVADITYKNEMDKKSPDLHHKRPLFKIKVINTLLNGGSILFNLVVVFYTKAEIS